MGALQPDKNKKRLRNWWHYVLAIVFVALITLLGHATQSFLTVTNIAMLFLIGVVVTAALWGLGPAILTCVLSVLAHDFFFVSPFFSLGPPDIHDVPTLIVLLLVGILISSLTSRIRWQAQEASRREHESTMLYDLSRAFSFTNELESTINSIINRAGATFEYVTVVFLQDDRNAQRLVSYKNNQDILINNDDYSAAALSFYQRKIVGRGTPTLPHSRARYVPLNSAKGPIGVLALYVKETSLELSTEQLRLLDIFADLSAVSIERALLSKKVQDSQIRDAKEKLQAALFSSITHDLRTPLVSIIGVLSSIRDDSMSLSDNTKNNLIQVASEEAERLNHLIANLLDSSRIESGSVKLHRQPSDILEIMSNAREQLNSSSKQIITDVPPDFPLISADFSLMTHVFVNILDNAFKYSHSESPVEIKARLMDDEVEVIIADKGIGIPSKDISHVFDRFYRVQRSENVPGTGLGLSICKGIVEAHNGSISAENRPGGGTIIRIVLPIEDESTGGK